MKLLVTGGCGFVGSNLSAEGIARRASVCVFDNLYRHGSAENLEWLRSRGDFTFVHGDIRSYNDVSRVVDEFKPDAVFHLAGQVAMTTSLANPRMDFEVNAVGSHNLLEAIRLHAPSAPIIFSSTNKVYGDLEQFHYNDLGTRWECAEHPAGFDESTPLDFHSPYGCSKGAADQYMRDYARMFGLRTVVFRHSTIYGGQQHSTVDQGWIGWFCEKALEIARAGGTGRVNISGTGKQVRDVLHISDVIRLYFAAIENIEAVAGEVFNIGGGRANSLSLVELLELLERTNGIKIAIERGPQRQGDQRVFIVDGAKIEHAVGWRPQVSFEDGIRRFLDWLGSR